MSVHATKELQAYWKENLVIIAVHLAIWFLSPSCLRNHDGRPARTDMISGIPLGSGSPNQGVEVTFVILIDHLRLA